MGYNTIFTGSLSFKAEPTAKQLAALGELLGEDCREHPEWEPRGEACYIDLILLPDYTGITWDDGTEKTYGLEDSVNIVLREMRKTWPDFGLTGQLLAQGEVHSDRWILLIGADGLAHKSKVALTGKIVTCPHCEEKFELEGSTT